MRTSPSFPLLHALFQKLESPWKHLPQLPLKDSRYRHWVESYLQWYQRPKDTTHKNGGQLRTSFCTAQLAKPAVKHVTGATIPLRLLTEVCENHWMTGLTFMLNTSSLGTCFWSRKGLGESRDFSTPFSLQVFQQQLTLTVLSTLSIGMVPRLFCLWGWPSIRTWHLLHQPLPISNNQPPPIPPRPSASVGQQDAQWPIYTQALSGVGWCSLRSFSSLNICPPLPSTNHWQNWEASFRYLSNYKSISAVI